MARSPAIDASTVAHRSQPFPRKGIERPPGGCSSFCRPHMKLKGLNALITGGSQGLGKAIAEHYLREGANVFLCARNERDLAAARDELASKVGSPDQKVLARSCDVSNEA